MTPELWIALFTGVALVLMPICAGCYLWGQHVVIGHWQRSEDHRKEQRRQKNRAKRARRKEKKRVEKAIRQRLGDGHRRADR